MPGDRIPGGGMGVGGVYDTHLPGDGDAATSKKRPGVPGKQANGTCC